MEMIDCELTKNYFGEKHRMCRFYKQGCFECPLSSNSDGKNKPCSTLEQLYTSEAVEIVQKWSNKHPKKTLLTEFLKNYPKTDLKNGLPPICAETLGLVDKECRHEFNECYMDCRECWNTPTKDSESEECK